MMIMSNNTEQFYTNFVNVLSSNAEVIVEIQDKGTPYYDTENDKIVITREDNERLEYASLFHELGHHLFTGNMPDDLARKEIVNAVEDVRIERFIVEKYPSVKSDLLELYERTRGKIGDQTIDNPILALRIILENKTDIFEDVNIDEDLKEKLKECVKVCKERGVLEGNYHDVYSVSEDLKKILFTDKYDEEKAKIKSEHLSKLRGEDGDGKGESTPSDEEIEKQENELRENLKKLEEKYQEEIKKVAKDFEEQYEDKFEKKTFDETDYLDGQERYKTLEEVKSEKLGEKGIQNRKEEAKKQEQLVKEINVEMDYGINNARTKNQFLKFLFDKVSIREVGSEEIEKKIRHGDDEIRHWNRYSTDTEEFKQYDSIALRISSELCRYLTFKNKQSSKRKNGTKLNMKSITRDISKHGEITDGRLFYNKKDILGNHSVLILVDFSGSMSESKKLINARKSLYILSKILEDLKINYAVHGFSSHNSQARKIIDYELKSFDDFTLDIEVLRKSWCFRDYWENRDGSSIQNAVDTLQKENGKKLLIVISDGLPNGRGNYHGDGAIAEMQFRVNKAIDNNIGVLGISIDRRADFVVKKVYPTNYSFSDNIDDIVVGLTEKYLQAIGVW